MIKSIQDILHALGITMNYTGYHYIEIAVELATNDIGRLCNIIKEIYQPVADICSCPCARVERNIRTVIFKAWNTNKALLIEIAGFKMYAPPTVSEFISILVAYLKCNQDG